MKATTDSHSETTIKIEEEEIEAVKRGTKASSARPLLTPLTRNTLKKQLEKQTNPKTYETFIHHLSSISSQSANSLARCLQAKQREEEEERRKISCIALQRLSSVKNINDKGKNKNPFTKEGFYN